MLTALGRGGSLAPTVLRSMGSLGDRFAARPPPALCGRGARRSPSPCRAPRPATPRWCALRLALAVALPPVRPHDGCGGAARRLPLAELASRAGTGPAPQRARWRSGGTAAPRGVTSSRSPSMAATPRGQGRLRVPAGVALLTVRGPGGPPLPTRAMRRWLRTVGYRSMGGGVVARVGGGGAACRPRFREGSLGSTADRGRTWRCHEPPLSGLPGVGRPACPLLPPRRLRSPWSPRPVP